MAKATKILLGASAAVVLAAPAMAQEAAIPDTAPGAFSAGAAFTFLLLAMGPFPLIPGFAALTAGRDRAFKLSLALMGVAIAAVAIVVAATIGVSTLEGWGVSTPALVLTTGLLLLIVALQALFGAHKPRPEAPEEAPGSAKPLPTRTELAFSPLAFPMILPPFGVGVVVVLLTLAQQRAAMPVLAGLILLVLALDFLAMILADAIMRAPFIKYALFVLGSIMGVLQASLAVEAIADAIRDLSIIQP
jgi:multiple antibiotic resistance protein